MKGSNQRLLPIAHWEENNNFTNNKQQHQQPFSLGICDNVLQGVIKMLLLRWNLFIKLIEPCPQHDRVSNSTDYGNFYVFKDAKVQKAFMIQFIAIYIHISKSWTGKHLFHVT